MMPVKNSHERRIRMTDDQKTDKGEETTADGRHDHTAHVAADRARKDGDHKAVRGLLLLTDDGANLVMHARVVAGHPVGKHQTKEDHEQLRGRIGDERGTHRDPSSAAILRHILDATVTRDERLSSKYSLSGVLLSVLACEIILIEIRHPQHEAARAGGSGLP